jgi:uncharacterized repeat protein (TIGR02543 family)
MLDSGEFLMYEEKKKNINWIKIFLEVFILFLIVLLAIKLITIVFSKRNYNKESSNLDNNLSSLIDTAKLYYVNDKLPSKVGDYNKTGLNDLVDQNVIDEVKDENGNTCDMANSYIEIIKLDKEYQFKAYLICGDTSDEKNDFVTYDNSEVKVETTTTAKVSTTTTTSVSTTKKVVNTTKKVTTTTTVSNKKVISFNTNGGKLIDSMYVTVGSNIDLPTPVRDGYTFIGWYVHSVKYTSLTVSDNVVLTAKWIKN